MSHLYFNYPDCLSASTTDRQLLVLPRNNTSNNTVSARHGTAPFRGWRTRFHPAIRHVPLFLSSVPADLGQFRGGFRAGRIGDRMTSSRPRALAYVRAVFAPEIETASANSARSPTEAARAKKANGPRETVELCAAGNTSRGQNDV